MQTRRARSPRSLTDRLSRSIPLAMGSRLALRRVPDASAAAAAVHVVAVKHLQKDADAPAVKKKPLLHRRWRRCGLAAGLVMLCMLVVAILDFVLLLGFTFPAPRSVVIVQQATNASQLDVTMEVDGALGGILQQAELISLGCHLEGSSTSVVAFDLTKEVRLRANGPTLQEIPLTINVNDFHGAKQLLIDQDVDHAELLCTSRMEYHVLGMLRMPVEANLSVTLDFAQACNCRMLLQAEPLILDAHFPQAPNGTLADGEGRQPLSASAKNAHSGTLSDHTPPILWQWGTSFTNWILHFEIVAAVRVHALMSDVASPVTTTNQSHSVEHGDLAYDGGRVIYRSKFLPLGNWPSPAIPMLNFNVSAAPSLIEIDLSFHNPLRDTEAPNISFVNLLTFQTTLRLDMGRMQEAVSDAPSAYVDRTSLI